MQNPDSAEKLVRHSATSAKKPQVQPSFLPQDETPSVTEDKDEEDVLRRKLDCFVTPVMMILMLLSYLDGGNIGFAPTQGMTSNVGLEGNQPNIHVAESFFSSLLFRSDRGFCRTTRAYITQTAVSVFCIFYILAEVSFRSFFFPPSSMIG